MQTTGYRSGRVGVLATLILLFSIVLFIGSLVWLGFSGPWQGGSLFGDDLFKPASLTPQQQEDAAVNVTVDSELNMTEAMGELEALNCFFTEYSDEYSEEKTTTVSYETFKEIAVDRKIVFTASRQDDSPVLLVVRDGNTYEWSP